MTVVTILPMFVNVSEDVLWIYHLFKLIPVNMFSFDNIIGIFSIDLFGLIVQPYEIIPAFATILSIVLLPVVAKFQKCSVIKKIAQIFIWCKKYRGWYSFLV